MIPCRHIIADQTCAIGRKPLDCACRSYDSAYNPSREQIKAWAKVTADIGSDRALGLYVLTHAAIGEGEFSPRLESRPCSWARHFDNTQRVESCLL
jgi:hypothetical protein